MDKSWISKPRNTPEYMNGLLKFLDFAFANASSNNRIKCPCSRCAFRQFQTREEVYDHLLLRPFPPGYKVWLLHGERDVGQTSSSRQEAHGAECCEDPMHDMLHDAFNFSKQHSNEDSTVRVPTNEDERRVPHVHDGPSSQAKEFYDLLRDGEQELYEGCSKYSKLSFLVKLYHIKCICGMSDKALSMIIELLKDAFEHAKIPESLYEAKKTIKKLGLNYKKIDACPNDCMLYWGLDKSLNQCKHCGTSRWKEKTKVNSSNEHEPEVVKNVHLVDEVKAGGPVHYRWMYPIERYLGRLKSYVRNKAQPEGSIVEGYLAEEILTFCSRYLDNTETRINRKVRVDDQPDDVECHKKDTLFPKVGRPVGGFSYFNLTPIEKLQAHRHVLINCEAIDPFLREFRTITKRMLRNRTRSQPEIDKVVHKEFPSWFQKLIAIDGVQHSNELRWLAHGPLDQAKRFNAYNVNGFKFRTLEREHGLKSQNSGVFGMFDTRSYASNRDNNVAVGGVAYYGKLVDIIELNYSGQFIVTLFKCLWADTTTDRGIKRDDLGNTCVNFNRLMYAGDRESDEPFILASEAQLVFYVDDEIDKGWSIATPLKPRDLFDMGENIEEMSIYDVVPSPQLNLDRWFQDNNEDLRLARDDDIEEEPITNVVDNNEDEEFV